ncbi:MAG: hypothetical protein A3J29_15410 [Acidobacteria bacterium RIFCSPLOWO2_12_FULL_67_14b]|nr:MAG: hypothetical protein A3J29_15410 [Acidobacteria bacterium RIFCSPLOWO2_12_FULL_67_14b]
MCLLEQVVEHSRDGIALTPLSTLAGLSKPTAHRLLVGLRNLGLVDYDASHLYYPGLKLFRMGIASAARFNMVRLAEAGMPRLAHETQDTVYLSLRSGDNSMCAARVVGSFPIRTLTLNVGDYRPLGLGAGSLALLACLPDAEVEGIIERNRVRLADQPNFTPAKLRMLVKRTREQGYALNEGLMLPEMAAVAKIVRDPLGRGIAALSIAAITSRMQPKRRETIVALLSKEARALELAFGSKAGQTEDK